MSSPHPGTPSLLGLMWGLSAAIWGWVLVDARKWRRGE